ncbi:ABC transporter substrate-binding protein [Cohnella sp. GCM10020058]|uniref:ABC transporter substrate-binding protein n=1 Tax=Cohnella sp. GCM10020058 TaxID=3317330 RepID=UPI00362E6DE5
MFYARQKKGIGYTLALSLVLTGALSACGNGNGDDKTSSPSGSASGTAAASPSQTATASGGAAPSESALDPYELTLYFFGDPQKDTELIEKEVDKYIGPKINATVKINFIPWAEAEQKVPVLLASGQKIDVLFTQAKHMIPLASKGALTPVNDLLEKYGQDALGSMYGKFLDLSKVGGKNYAVQNPKEIASEWVLRFNKPLADKNGIDLSGVKSIADAEPVLKQLKEKDPTIYPIEPSQQALWYVPFDYVMNENIPFGMIYDPAATDGKIVNMWETSQAKQALATVRAYYKAGYVRPDAATYKRPDNEEQAGKWLTGIAGGIPTADVIWSNRAGFDVTYAPIEKPIVTTSSVMGSMLTIPTTSKNPERAMMFINLLHADKYLHNLFVYGIEGVHYEKVSDNVVKDLPARKERWNTGWFQFGNGFLTYLTEADPADKWDQFKAFNEQAQVSPLVGFVFDPTPVQAEIANIQNVTAAIKLPLITGSVDPDKFLPSAIEKLKDAGSDKVIAEMQKQYDAWKAAQ